MRWAHLTSDQLVDYFSRDWLPEQEAAIEIHLADCDTCAQKASIVFEILGLTETWTARAQEKSLQAQRAPDSGASSAKAHTA